MESLFEFAIEVLEGISSTVDGGVYNIISHTPVNPLLLDDAAIQLLEQQAGTALQSVVNDAGEVVGYVAKGVANAGNGAAGEVSTYINVLTQEVEVTAEMAAETYIDAATGEVAQLTVGETVTTIGAEASGAGILAMDVGLAGAAIAPALGILAGVGLYNIAPEFWDGVSANLVAAGESVAGKVQGFFNADGQTGFSEDTINIFKDAFLEAEYFTPRKSVDMSAQQVSVSEGLEPFMPSNLTFSGSPQYHCDTTEGSLWWSAWFPDATTEQVGFCYEYFDTTNNIQAGAWGVASKTNDLFGYAGGRMDTRPTEPTTTMRGTAHVVHNEGLYIQFNDTIFDSQDFLVGNINLSPAAGPLYNNLIHNIMAEIAFFCLYGISTTVSDTQPDATLPDENPVGTTYPDWQDWTKPVQQDKNIKSVSIPNDDTTQDDSQSGDNTDDDIIGIISDLIQNTPKIDPTPSPEPDPDPSDQPVQPEETDVIPQEDPIDPNPDPEVSGDTPLVPDPDSTKASRMFTVYTPTDQEVNNLGAYLWNSSIIEQIKQMWEDPMQCIISFHKVYCAPVSGSYKHIVLGYLDSGVSALEVTSQFKSVDCGTVNVKERLHNATDYTPFSKCHIYLPFVGIVEIDIADVMAGSLHIKYQVDVYTGTCAAMLFCKREPDMPNEQLLYTFSGNASQQLPLTGANFTGAINGLLGLAGAGVAVAAGGGVGLAAGAVSAAHSLTQEMVHVQRSGGLSANAGILTPRKPYIIISRQSGYDANNYNAFYGFPANKTVVLSNISGYVKIKHIHLQTSATEAENDIIISELKNGVII